MLVALKEGKKGRNVPGTLRVRLVERGKAIDFYFFTSVPTNPSDVGEHHDERRIHNR